jgi:hypothetical protein
MHHVIDQELDGEGITDLESALVKCGINDTDDLIVRENGMAVELDAEARWGSVVQVYPKALEDKGGVSGHHTDNDGERQTLALAIRGVGGVALLRHDCTTSLMKILLERFSTMFGATASERTDPFKAVAMLTRMAAETDGERCPSLVTAPPRDVRTFWVSLPDLVLHAEDIETGEHEVQPALGEVLDKTDEEPPEEAEEAEAPEPVPAGAQ